MDATTQTSLTRLLGKLDQTILDPNNTDDRLRRSQFERNRVSANVEHARTLLLTLEKQSATVRVQSQRQSIQADLQSKREGIKKLQARLQELDQGAEDEEDDDDESDEDEAITTVTDYGPARKDTEAGLDVSETPSSGIDPASFQNMRNRKPLQASDNRAAASTTAREQLFSGRPKDQLPSDETSRTETLMTHNRTEQENLTTGLIGLARALKESSVQFSGSLAAEKEILNRAEGGLDSSAKGMEAAEWRMGMLRRMTEGKGWFARLKLYGLIAGLWVAAFLLVFIGPKLRF
ncbi:hypothetical protein LTR78_006744 [Recurvomyces mirabilis]|uniref:Synaptobrevin n=1 Tax=Recurvomyces mirabilis TaxID=574656 RepID=A0AAE0WKS0_9PEZI|nr:hypothetical protein LTR78_006744 [Recurvomyces mirabilis]KAK5151367.1 hypothetical protein LTS14_009210 [Recurvomyces mirabilis]